MEINLKKFDTSETESKHIEVLETINRENGIGLGVHESGESLFLEKAQELAEKVHKMSSEQILELNGEYLSSEGKERLSKGADSLSVVPYRVGMENIGSFSFRDGRSEIKVCPIDVDQIERTTQHETNHFASYNVENSEVKASDNRHVHVTKVSGIHSLEYKEDSHQRIVEFTDLNRGFNEGITQMYTNRQLELRQPGKGVEAARQNGYMFATELSEQVEQIVGEDVVASAYYGGKLELLSEKINTLGGEGAFERLSKDIDKVTYSSDYIERIYAMRDAQELLADMSEGDAA